MPDLVDKVLSQESLGKMRGMPLGKLAAARLQSEGFDINDIDLRSASQVIGTKMFAKNASYGVIFDGLIALRNLTKGE